MRKQSKRLLSMILSAAMVVTLGAGTVTGNKVSAEDVTPADTQRTELGTTFYAYLTQNNSKIFNSTEKVYEGEEKVAEGVVASSGAIDKTGEYTISAIAEDEVEDLLASAAYLGVEFGNLGKTLAEDGKTVLYKRDTLGFAIKAKSIEVTDKYTKETTTYDWSKATLYNNSADEEERLRFGIRNKWGTADSEKEYTNPIDGEKIYVGEGDTFTVRFEVTTGKLDPLPYTEKTEDPGTGTTTPKASYNGYITFQTDNWAFRNIWNDPDGYGLKDKKLDYTTQYGVPGDTENDDVKGVTAKITDCKMTDNGEYTVSISGADLKNLQAGEKKEKATAFTMLSISTDIPMSMSGVSAVNAKLEIDGKEVKLSKTTLPNKSDAKNYGSYYNFMVANSYGNAKDAPFPASGKGASTLTTLPTDSIKITFTLKGADFSGKVDYTTKTIGVKKNKTFTSGNFKYKVTKAATITAGKKKNGTVTVVGLTAAGKKKSSISVKNSVSKTVDKVKATYTVNKLGDKAFKKAKKLKKATLGTKITAIPTSAFEGCAKLTTVSAKGVKKIGKSAFKGCKKLNKLTLKKKVSVKKGAFKGCKKTIKVTGGTKKVNKANVKTLKKKSGYKKFK
ncbi:MAG: leucine-rich repeat protein [Lachnospiraceae bacterium]|nr:leucine-rich repeat protein [Lachnospiraceae bacterium]